VEGAPELLPISVRNGGIGSGSEAGWTRGGSRGRSSSIGSVDEAGGGRECFVQDTPQR
jgi:hypothetical protein